MPFPMTCQSCSAQLRVGRGMRGRKIVCPKCGKAMIASAKSSARRKVVVSRPAPRQRSTPEGRTGLLPLFFAIAVLAAGYGLAVRYLPHRPQRPAVVANGDDAKPVEIAKNDSPPDEPVTPAPVTPPVEKAPEIKPPEVKPPEVRPPEVKPPETKPPEVKPPPPPIVKVEAPKVSPPPPVKEPEPKTVVVVAPPEKKVDPGRLLSEAILAEIKRFPAMTKSQNQKLQALTVDAFPPSDLLLDDYRDEAFNPFQASASTIAEMKSKFPLRVAANDIAAALTRSMNLSMRDEIGSPLDVKLKARLHLEQKEPALMILTLQELYDEARKIAETRDLEKSKRWQAHFDLALVRLQSRIVHLYEYDNLLAQVRSDSLPTLAPGENAWRAAAVIKVQTKEAAVKDLAKQIGKSWTRLAGDCPNTPWASIAEQEKTTPLGLDWMAITK